MLQHLPHPYKGNTTVRMIAETASLQKQPVWCALLQLYSHMATTWNAGFRDKTRFVCDHSCTCPFVCLEQQYVSTHEIPIEIGQLIAIESPGKVCSSLIYISLQNR